MATFEPQVAALTGIDIDGSSDPTQTELSAFLVDGVMDVANRMIEVRPAELSKFTKTTNAVDSVAKTGKILSVVREHDSTSILRKCTPIDPSDRYDATDTDSLNYRSKTNPGYYELNGLIICVPEAGSGNNDIVVTQVHYDTGLINSDNYQADAIENFPKEYEYLVALYAAMKSLSAKMGAIRNSLSSFSITAVPPDMPTTGIGLPTYETSSTSVGSGTVDDEIAKMLTYIETDEDVELANAKATEVTLRLKRALEKFNADVVEYKVENEGEIAHYSVEINAYTADVNAQAQDQIQNIATETARYQWLQERYAAYTQEYFSAFAVPGGGE